MTPRYSLSLFLLAALSAFLISPLSSPFSLTGSCKIRPSTGSISANRRPTSLMNIV